MTETDRIMYVDDDRPVRSAFARSVKMQGFEVDLAAGAEEALALCDRYRYAVVATDFNMPDVNGLDLVEKLRERQPHSAYMLVSGFCDLHMALDAVNEHRLDYVLPKPWDVNELVMQLRRGVETYWERKAQSQIQTNAVNVNNAMVSQKMRLEEALNRSETIMAEMLLNALDLRGHETQAHCRRVAAYAMILAQEMGVGGATLTSTQQGALLHDVGRIAIPDKIMDKPGALTDEEWEVVRGHPTVGAKLLEGFDSLSGARQVVMEHHEAWDGSGYPQRLSGERISIGARIVAVADALDAMLSERPHRCAASLDVAVGRIWRLSAAQFDPRVVEAFMRVERSRWLEVRKVFPEEQGGEVGWSEN